MIRIRQKFDSRRIEDVRAAVLGTRTRRAAQPFFLPRGGIPPGNRLQLCTHIILFVPRAQKTLYNKKKFC